jgi:hypothetical protein
MLDHILLDRIDESLRDLVPPEAVALKGAWTPASRRTYTSAAQSGTGPGPAPDVVDLRWHGTLTASGPIGGIAFLLTAENLYWAKAAEVSPALPVDVSLHAYADHLIDRATFTARLAGAFLPGVPVSRNADLAQTCAIEAGAALTTGRVACLARTDATAFFVLLIQRGLLEIGRKRLWRIRDEIASSLAPGVRELLTRGRTGTVLSETV